MFNRAKNLLKEIYGYDSFRFGQEKIVRGILNQRETLGILPTGGGKSICYQVPALIFNGMTIVVSPLISLMKDQVDTLNQLGISSAYINSTLDKDEYASTMRRLRQNKIKLL